MKYIENEINILKKIGDHANIVKLFECYGTDTHIFLILELLEGGELLDRIVKSGAYSEARASEHLRRIASALFHLHTKNVIHRDLKPENLLLTTSEIDSEIKICDFGLANFIENSNIKTVMNKAGTWFYSAPEVLKYNQYSPAVDMWALGVIMFIMLAGYHPFDPLCQMREKATCQRIMNCEYDFLRKGWSKISDQAKDLIIKCFEPDPKERITAYQFLKHDWIKNPSGLSTEPLSNEMLENLQAFKQKSKHRRESSIHYRNF